MLNVYHRPNQAAATIFIPHRTFFGTLRRRIRRVWSSHGSYLPMVKPKEPYMPSKRAKKVRLGIYRTQIRPSEYDIGEISGQ